MNTELAEKTKPICPHRRLKPKQWASWLMPQQPGTQHAWLQEPTAEAEFPASMKRQEVVALVWIKTLTENRTLAVLPAHWDSLYPAWSSGGGVRSPTSNQSHKSCHVWIMRPDLYFGMRRKSPNQEINYKN